MREYGKFKTTPTEEERTKKKYLDKQGMPDNGNSYLTTKTGEWHSPVDSK